MNVQEYILSGILEAYVLDQLSENERSEVQLMAQTYPEVKDEIEAIEDALHLFAEKTAVTPPQSLKAKLFDELNEESASVEEEKTIGVPKKKDRSFYRFFSIAASVAAIVAIFFSVYYYREWKTAQSKYTDLLAQNQEMAQQFNLTKQKMDQYHDQIQFLTQPGVETVAMKGL
ncbi:MAG TPA: hypothetical protein VKA27_18880, partial [Sunxiuqinia sp.]|nr:hypothetical protein [Sunxiuqinia sp.]